MSGGHCSLVRCLQAPEYSLASFIHVRYLMLAKGKIYVSLCFCRLRLKRWMTVCKH